MSPAIRFPVLSVAALLAGGAAQAEGDPRNGEVQFNRQCTACHVIVAPDGARLAGRNAQTGPNLYGIAGEAPGAVPGFDFGDAIIRWGATGAVWDEENFTGYVMNPTQYVRGVIGDNRARVKMSYSMRNEQDARDVWAYIVSLEQ